MKKLEEAIANFDKKKIAVIGDTFIDEFVYGEIRRINPDNPTAHLVNVKKVEQILGGAGNVANNLVSLGAKCDLYGRVGEDVYGFIFRDICEKKGISFKCSFSENPTIIKQRIIAHKKQVLRNDYHEHNLEKVSKIGKNSSLLDFIEKNLSNNTYDYIILSDYDKQTFSPENSKELISLISLKNMPLLVDPKPSNINNFFGCTAVKLNHSEAEKTTGIDYSNGASILEKMAKELSKKLNTKYTIITCGGDGAFCYESDGKSLMLPTKARQVSDSTGAGDTFAAALALGLSSNLSLEDSTKLANYSAGVVVDKVGTSILTQRELLERIYLDSAEFRKP